MKHQTKTPKTKKVVESLELDASAAQALVFNQTDQDLKTAILVVSLFINAFVLVGWILLQVTTVYDFQVATFLFIR
ncbi:hypothetical protein A2707_05745 [Candidatus Saccharibacteria bacterium RIFCSPHIGHO2_01_FULL_45_15]|nr:MAG: hypothetical protein A2707_05745 [Candidatus Saccharibacteria bacterium RIFCSPHIGHO2_01_FULL_45_15]OGL28949.1 MAG: hypothetical protein A3C39_05965 [Candidatus Saccharibacteria bacterium RIFCSPHIGHO2_02_FULL_46_12]OGL31963.1 MAG: hypothetical protein A3E76_01690 [Candidatus Saccharibacteria bacterium RIFCSPHIGHO2_12_FULL_44_22]